MSNRALSILCVLALAIGSVGLILNLSAASEAPVARGFLCAPGVICFSDGGKTALVPSGARLQLQSGAALQVNSGATFTNAANLVLGSETVSGAVHYGVIGNPANGDRIAHGFTTTPTACTVTPTTTGAVTATITAITSTGFAVSVGAATGVYWLCGR